MLNVRNLILSVVLVMFLLAVPLVAARTEVASGLSSSPVMSLNHQNRYDKMNSHPAITLDHQNRYDKMNKVPIPSYRSPFDECFDVGLIYHAQCLKESQEATP
jgi:hypothetical protein